MHPVIDRDRLLARLDELGRIGATATGGVTRLAFSPEDVAARSLVGSWLSAAGMDVHVDSATNLVGRRVGRAGLPGIVTGSHLDTVVDGGRLDGAYGVVAAAEVATALADAGASLRHDLLVAAFADEEGARGSLPMAGSRAIVGAIDDLALGAADTAGVTLGERIGHAGGDPDGIAGATWAPGTVAACIELHIEQGPVLEDSQVAVGIVESITGQIPLEVIVSGAPRHAGTTPMDRRSDALAAAARLVLEVESLARGGRVRTATVGSFTVEPSVRNVVPGRVRLGVDLRDDDATRLDAAVIFLRSEAARIAWLTGTVVAVEAGEAIAPVAMDAHLRSFIAAAADYHDLGHRPITSGAGHDAQILARLAPAAVVFVPSTGGISHSPEEHTPDDQLVDGARVLLDAVLIADRCLSPTRTPGTWSPAAQTPYMERTP